MANRDPIADQAKSLITAALDLNEKKIKEMIGADKQYDSSLVRARNVGKNPDIGRLHTTYGDITKNITTWNLPALTSIDTVQARRDEDNCIDIINKSRDQIAKIDNDMAKINFKIIILNYINEGDKSNEEIFEKYSEKNIKNTLGKSLDDIRTMKKEDQEKLIDRVLLEELKTKKEALAANAGYANQLGQKLANLIRINDAYQINFMLNAVSKTIPAGRGPEFAEACSIAEKHAEGMGAREIFGEGFKRQKALDVIQHAYAIDKPDPASSLVILKFLNKCEQDPHYRVANNSVFIACKAAKIANAVDIQLKAVNGELNQSSPNIAKLKQQIASIEIQYSEMMALLPGRLQDREKKVTALREEIQGLKNTVSNLEYINSLTNKQKEVQDVTIKLDSLKMKANDLEAKLDKKGFSLSETIGSINPFADNKAHKVEKNQAAIKELQSELASLNKQLIQHRDSLNEILGKVNAQPNKSLGQQQSSKMIQENLQRINDVQGRINETNRQLAKLNLNLLNSLDGQEKGMAMIKSLADYARAGNQTGIDIFLKDKKAMSVVVKMLTDAKSSAQVNQEDAKSLLNNEAIKSAVDKGLHGRWSSAPGKTERGQPKQAASNNSLAVDRSLKQSQSNQDQQDVYKAAPSRLGRS